MASKPGPPVDDEPAPRPLRGPGTLRPLLSPPTPTMRDVDAPLSASAHGDRYLTRSQLGQGGMGEVNLCDDLRIGREVAFKVLRDGERSADAVPRFLREARVQGQLEHPAVVPVYDLGVDQAGTPWFSMKRIRGLSLAEILTGLAAHRPEFEARFNRRRLLSAFSTVCLAVDYAHARGVLHRDLKPGNVMIGDFGEVHLIDWGLARVHGASELPVAKNPEAQALSHTLKGELMGSPGYMSPEQARGEHVTLTAASDVYSLGVILFELLTLQPMVTGDIVERIHDTLKGGDWRPSVSAPDAEVPPELDTVVVKATALDARQRYGTARELADEIERYLDGDRDQQGRAALAVELVEGARTKSASQDLTERAAAVKSLVRAVALDPGQAEAPKLLAAALTDLPAQLPPEVVASFRLREEKIRATGGRLAGLRFALWLGWLPLLMAMGVRSWPMISLMVLATVATVAFAFLLARRPLLGPLGGALVFAASSLSLTFCSAVVGPLVLIPLVAATNAVYFSALFARRWLILGGLAPILLPWLAEKAGLIPPAYLFGGATIEILPRVVDFPPVLSEALLLATSVAGVLIPALMLSRVRKTVRDSEVRLFLHSWLLRR